MNLFKITIDGTEYIISSDKIKTSEELIKTFGYVSTFFTQPPKFISIQIMSQEISSEPIFIKTTELTKVQKITKESLSNNTKVYRIEE